VDGQPRGPRGTLKIALPTEPETLHSKMSGGRGLNEFFWMFNSFLTYYDFEGVSHPMLAESIPGLGTSDWIINSDGTMVTTYRLRSNARWHDGAPLTAQDFLLGYEIAIDPDMPIRDRSPEALISAVEAPDARTIVIRWREPYVSANRLTYQEFTPVARHLVEEKYRNNRANFTFGDEWTSAYVGTGPYRIDRWTPGAGLVARAFPDWVLGPPKIETLDIRFISDARTQLANLLAGEVGLITSPGIEAPEGIAARDHWGPQAEGYIRTWIRNIRYMEFQYRDVPNWQRAIADPRVRQAIMHATDRQGLLEVVQLGLGSTSDLFLAPTEPSFREAERVITRYPYDPSRAAAVLAEAGWRAPRAGTSAANAAGATLDLSLWTTAGSGADQEAAIVIDGWKAAGINASFNVIASALQRDNELRVSFPAANLTSRNVTLDNFVFTAAHAPTAEVRWQGANRGSFSDPEIERLQNLVLTSFVPETQTQAIVALHKRMTEIVGVAPLFYGVGVIAAKNKVKGPLGEVTQKSGMTWNVFDWEIVE
jgi:peptide/nickel transport system substrate-binding protein